ncbi:MAG TPA: cytochrome c biogenesis protein CcdA [Syntrophales bacterium]|nr:cytochrome c biogenesis protein CcdA [Syntrophales bacterium]HQG35061.1 cytochrome c biogenesis protein CcdA [Syntrophales bacterium]HQJ31106.1 cytochrome c biogenesis protein CcdA [Syntrophales bacterium]
MMAETFFLTVNEWLTGSPLLAAAGSFFWGMISVLFSPCHLASIPLMVAYVAGQREVLAPRRAGLYAVLFSGGLFLSIAAVGMICALLGRMLGDVGPYWQILVGLVLLWVALGMFGVQACSISGGGILHRLNLQGHSGAFLLGLAYGILSGSCTFGFIAPILAIITIQQQVAMGLILITLFAVGHSLPILAAGTSAALVGKMIENQAWQRAGDWFRKGAGGVIILLAIYFIGNPFFGN